jgi:hypothetical protein
MQGAECDRMASEYHTFDPDGDLLIILSRPPPDDAERRTEISGDGGTNTPAESETQGVNGDAAPESTAQTEANGEDDVTGTSADFADADEAESEGKQPDIAVHMLVSSKHMMLASPVFRAMLQHSTFKE